MGLADRLAERAETTPCAGPKMPRIIAELDDDERDVLLAALASDMPHRAIARALTDEGYGCSEKAVSHWREVNGWASQSA